jgi:hypothetical protein
MDIINTQKETDIAPTRPATLRPCVVCGLRTDVLLCRECAAQPVASKARVLAWLGSNSAQAGAAMDAWDAIREPHQAYWEKIQDAREQPGFQARCAKHRAAQDVYGQLLDAQAEWEQAIAPLNVERRRLEKALAVLNGIADPPSPRPNEYAIPEGAAPTTCRSCGAGMVFVKTPAGKALPLSVATIQTRDGVRWAIPHFADCKDAKKWSKR